MDMDEQLIKAMEELDDSAVLGFVQQLLEQKTDRFWIMHLLNEGMKQVGVLYEKGDYFIADLILSGMIYKNILELPQMQFEQTADTKPKGRVLVGTAEGDIHDIGKDLFISILTANGYNVTDLGTDVKPVTFVSEAERLNPDIVAISGTMTFSIYAMKKTIGALEENPLTKDVKVIVGGSCIDKLLSRQIGADAFSGDPLEGLSICNLLLEGWKGVK